MPARAANWNTLSEEEKCERLKAQALRRQSSRGSQRAHGPRRYHRWDDLTEAQKCDVLRAKMRGEHDNVTVRKRKKDKHPPGEKRKTRHIIIPEEEDDEEPPPHDPDYEALLRDNSYIGDPPTRGTVPADPPRRRSPPREEWFPQPPARDDDEDIDLLEERADDDDVPPLADAGDPAPDRPFWREPAGGRVIEAQPEPVAVAAAPPAAAVIASMMGDPTTTFLNAIPRRIDIGSAAGPPTVAIKRKLVPIRIDPEPSSQQELAPRGLFSRMDSGLTGPVQEGGFFSALGPTAPWEKPEKGWKKHMEMTPAQLDAQFALNKKKHAAEMDDIIQRYGGDPKKLHSKEKKYLKALAKGKVKKIKKRTEEEKAAANDLEFDDWLVDDEEDEAPKKKAKKQVFLKTPKFNANAAKGSFGKVKIAPSGTIPGVNTGVGLFATRDIPAGYAITEYAGEWHTTPSVYPVYDVAVYNSDTEPFDSDDEDWGTAEERREYERNNEGVVIATAPPPVHYLSGFQYRFPGAPKFITNWRGEQETAVAFGEYDKTTWHTKCGQYGNDARDDRNNAVIMEVGETVFKRWSKAKLPDNPCKDYRPDYYFRGLDPPWLTLRMFIVSTEPIKKDQEIFIDYGYTEKDWDEYAKENKNKEPPQQFTVT